MLTMILSMAEDDDTIDGDAGDDSLYGEAGDDTIYTGSGNDNVNAGLNDDTANVDAAGNKVINGFAGTDTLNSNYRSYDISDFVTLGYTSSSSTASFPHSLDDNLIEASNFEYFTINGTTYRLIYDGYDFVSQQQINNGTSCDISNAENNRISHAFISNDGTKIFLFTPSDASCTNYTIPSSVAFGTPSSSYSSSNLSVTITGSDILS